MDEMEKRKVKFNYESVVDIDRDIEDNKQMEEVQKSDNLLQVQMQSQKLKNQIQKHANNVDFKNQKQQDLYM